MADTVSNPVDAEFKELAEWMEQPRRSGRRSAGDADEARLLLSLLHDHMGIGLADLVKGDLDELLLEVYPGEVPVLEADEVDGVIPTVRQLLAFCRDTRRLSAAKANRLEAELEEIEPLFADAVTSSADLAPYGEEVDLAEAFGLPDRLPPLRLPEDSELAEAARLSVLLNHAGRLATWVGGEREIADGYDLAPPDAAEAAAALGISVDELAYVWHFADHAGFLSFHATYVTPGPAAEDWPSADDDRVLDTWQLAFAEVLSCGLFTDVEAEEQAARGLDFDSAGVALVMMLFLSGTAGVPAAELCEILREAATADEDRPSGAEEQDDPSLVLLGRLRDLGVVETHRRPADDAAEGTAGSSEEVMRLTSLARWALRIQLEESGVDVPILPPVHQITAADLIALADGGGEQEVAAEMAAWVELRGAETVVCELLQTASTGSTTDRLFATALAAQVGAAAEPQWHRALDDPRLRPYAKIVLASLAGTEPPNAPAGPEPTLEDLAWLLTDAIAATCRGLEPDEVTDELRGSFPSEEKPQELMDAMWRLPHPDIVEVLTLIGDHHPDKKIAKSARKAVFKARSRSSTSG